MSRALDFDPHYLSTSLVDTVLAEKSLFHFTQQAWPIVEQGREFQASWHHQAICEALERVARGECRRLIINIPFRTTKSTIVSVMFPAWIWIHRPAWEVVSGSHAEALAIRDAVKTRRLCESAWYQERWPHVVFQTDQNQKTRYELKTGGRRLIFGMRSGVTGEGGDCLIIDDPHPAKEGMWSDVEREKASRTFDSELFSRLNDSRDSAIIIVMQRLHEDDLTGHVEKTGDWEKVCLPMRYDPAISSHHDQRGEPGELLHPERFGEEYVAKAERTLGPFGASGQLQQSPVIPGGGLFRDEDWRFYDTPPDRFDFVICSWDLTFGTTGSGSFAAGQTWAKKGPDTYLLDRFRKRLDFSGETAQIKALRESALGRGYHLSNVLIENKADGAAAINVLHKEIPGVLPWPPKGRRMGSKEVRAAAWAPRVASGNVFLPRPDLHPWVREFIAEHSAFPKGSTDDEVDAASQAHEWFSERERAAVGTRIEVLTSPASPNRWSV
jgi:predicted phage terminase large subunit-like protein